MPEKLIFSRMIKVMAEISHIGKGRKNVQQNYQFRGIDDVYNAVHEAMVKNEVFVLPEILDIQREERTTKSGGALTVTILKVKFTFCTVDGSSVSVITTGEGMDSGDKSANKALSGAQKYAFFQTFCIPTEEKKDSEYENPDLAPKAVKTQSEGLKLSTEELIRKMQTAKNIHELNNRVKKYSPDISEKSDTDRQKIKQIRDMKKADFDLIDLDLMEGAI